VKLFLTLLFAVSFIFLGLTQTVPPSVQALLGCQSNVPFLSVDFTGNPVGSTTVTGQSRNGFCCSASGSDKCMVVEFTLDPSAVGVQVIPFGATASGSLTMWINGCSTPYNFGDILCLSGAGPHYFVLCKPGTNAYDFKISSIPASGTSGSINTVISCTKLIAAYGFTESSLSWTSTSPGTAGQYNNFITNPQGTSPGTSGVSYTGQDTILVTPQSGFTGTLVYRVCGNVPGNACVPPSTGQCYDVTVTVYPTVTVTMSPANPVICSTGNPTLTPSISGGLAPYTYSWSGPSNNGSSASSLVASAVGTYTVSVTDGTSCPAQTGTTTVLAAPAVTGTSNQTKSLNENSNRCSQKFEFVTPKHIKLVFLKIL
jgi:hypothetical protein